MHKAIATLLGRIVNMTLYVKIFFGGGYILCENSPSPDSPLSQARQAFRARRQIETSELETLMAMKVCLQCSQRIYPLENEGYGHVQ